VICALFTHNKISKGVILVIRQEVHRALKEFSKTELVDAHLLSVLVAIILKLHHHAPPHQPMSRMMMMWV
jgi:uncharacterized membrane protein (DUF4010 family)